TEHGIRQALDRANKERGKLHVMLKKHGGVQELLNQPARWELFIKTAQGELAQARRLAGSGDGGLDVELTEGLDRLEQQLTNDKADYGLGRRLEKIRLDRAPSWEAGEFDSRTAAGKYSKALAGFAPLPDEPAAVVARITSCPIKEQL